MAFNTYGEYTKSMKAGGRGKQVVSEAQWKERKLPVAVRPLTSAQLQRQANKMARAQIAPELAGLDIERQRARDEYTANVNAERETTAALMPILQSLAPRVSDQYRQSAQGLAAIGKGFSSGIENAASEQAAGLEGQLAALNAPVTGITQATGAGVIGDVLYGNEAYLPATQIEREAAGFGALAELIPGYEAGRGRMRLQEIAGEREQAIQELADKEMAVRGKIGGLRAESLAELSDRELQKYGARMTERELSAKVTGVDPVTGKPTQDAIDQAADNAVAAADAVAGLPENDPDYYTDAKGRVVPKGYEYRNGKLVRIASSESNKKTKKAQDELLDELSSRLDDDLDISGMTYAEAANLLASYIPEKWKKPKNLWASQRIRELLSQYYSPAARKANGVPDRIGTTGTTSHLGSVGGARAADGGRP